MPGHQRPPSESSMLSGVMPDNFVRLPVSRWGNQKRFKCRNCTCYMASPGEDGVLTCKKCKATYYPYSNETYSMVMPDAASA